MGILDIFSKNKESYHSLKNNYKLLQDDYLKLKALNKELSDNLELMRKENQYYADYIIQLRQASNNEKSVKIEENIGNIPDAITPSINVTPRLQDEPRYTNLGDESLRMDKFPGKIGYIPRKK